MLFYHKLQIESHNLKCLFASRLPGEPAPVSTEEGVRWMHQVGPSEGPLALGKQLWKPRSAALSQEALNLGLLCQEACFLPRRPSSCNAFQVCPWEPSGWSAHRTGIECLLLGGLGAMCRDGWPRYVSASVAKSVVSRSLLRKQLCGFRGLPRWDSGKESTCQCRRHERHGFDPWVRKISWRRKWGLP